jgi:hypothetical protein
MQFKPVRWDAALKVLASRDVTACPTYRPRRALRLIGTVTVPIYLSEALRAWLSNSPADRLLAAALDGACVQLHAGGVRLHMERAPEERDPFLELLDTAELHGSSVQVREAAARSRS